ncbi:HTH-type transcriptional repressor AllR [Yersinia intermedia]|uniref:HTH-type transcriptional repressor AllR n=1 Tax=Yersinia intermedia TaxID=631 RepID=UPI0005DA73E3|nr:HTH-type transcriptional repressor AllR [Yersinia intermedia]MCB5299472.1 HTH-type transcriptional repressor AllR [Yersinia intermedia]OVZ76600.1 transcriptional regulator [Yersinia intermedia]CNH98098.1 IclR family transcriptional regulator [Yersinia intermedia]CNJ55625.1 IclR family transcriptional regulator [Yersinia intermedia]
MTELRRKGRPLQADTSATKGAQALDRGLEILQYLAISGGSATVSILSDKLALPLSTTFRLLKVLEKSEFVFQDPQLGWWHIGIQSFTVGSAYMNDLDVVSIAGPYMRRLMRLSGETANLAIRNNMDAVLIRQCECQAMVRMCAPLGSRLPLHASGAGKALLYPLAEDERLDLIVNAGLQSYTPKTITSLNMLEKDLLLARGNGYTVDDEEHALGLNCVASAIFDRNNDVIAAISISGPSSRMSEDRFTELGELVRDVANDISAALGESRKKA